MIIHRWQARILPTPEQARNIFLAEDLRPSEELLNPGEKIADHRHPFDEVRMILSGELLVNLAGNQVLLRAGDRILIPSNTKHSKAVHGEEICLSLVAQKPF